MYLEFIKKCINNLKKDDIKTYAINNKIELENNELELIYNTIKVKWKEIYDDGIKVINEYKNQLKESTYKKLLELYKNIKRY